MKKSKMLCVINLLAVAVISISLIFISPAWAGNRDLDVKVMTRNMYPGADLGILATATETNFPDVVETLIGEIIQSRIPERAALVAEEIAETQPDLIALQEATTWKIGSGSSAVVLDQMDLLLRFLRARGLHYRKAAVQTLTDVEIPGVITYTDHDAILVRTDLPPGHLMILGSEKHAFDELLSFQVLDDGITVDRGWMAVDVKIRGARFKFVNTHLESPLPGDLMQPTQAIQFAQAMQLVDDLTETRLPIILAGDFNSDAEPTHLYETDVTPSYGYIVDAGYLDAWHELYPADYGYTWPLFLNDPTEGVDPIERIDLIFSNDPVPTSIARTGMDPAPDGLFASDHIGVVATFDLENHRPDTPGNSCPRGRHSNGRNSGRH
jgi:endonuclease/exonuclease/phosphatase family metal-dependent hydrolase